MAASALLALAVAASLGQGGTMVARAQADAGQQATAASAQQPAADAGATEAAAQQAVSNELQQTENLEFQTLNEERPPALQQIEP
jgi:uncharacterized protein HemX